MPSRKLICMMDFLALALHCILRAAKISWPMEGYWNSNFKIGGQTSFKWALFLSGMTLCLLLVCGEESGCAAASGTGTYRWPSSRMTTLRNANTIRFLLVLFRDQLLSLSKIGTLILKLSFGLRWYERRLLVLGQDWLLDNLQKNNVVLRVFKRDRESVMHVMTAVTKMILTSFDKRKWIFEFRARTMTRAKNKWRGPLDTWWSTHMSPYRLALELP